MGHHPPGGVASPPTHLCISAGAAPASDEAKAPRARPRQDHAGISACSGVLSVCLAPTVSAVGLAQKALRHRCGDPIFWTEYFDMGFDAFRFWDREKQKHTNHVLPQPVGQTLGATLSLTVTAPHRCGGGCGAGARPGAGVVNVFPDASWIVKLRRFRSPLMA